MDAVFYERKGDKLAKLSSSNNKYDGRYFAVHFILTPWFLLHFRLAFPYQFFLGFNVFSEEISGK